MTGKKVLLKPNYKSAAPVKREPNPWPVGLKAPYCPVSSTLLKYMGSIGISPLGALLIIQLHDFKRLRNGVAYPSLATLAERVGRSEREVRRVIAKLEQQQLVVRKSQSAGERRTNEYDMKGLYDRLIELRTAERNAAALEKAASTQVRADDEPPL